MENTTLINLSRQTALRRKMDVIANNLANMNTSGYKAESLAFEDYMMPVAREDQFNVRSDRKLHFVLDYKSHTDLSGGSTEFSGNPFDIAIEGEGWFQIQTPQGERYTRNGSFTLNPQGQLVTHQGYPVLSDGSPIQIDTNAKDITIAKDGTISAGGNDIGKLTVFRFDAQENLTRNANQLFAGTNPIAIENPRISQGAIEQSNVKPISEMTQMIEVNKAYQELSNLMKKHEDMRRDAIQTLGRLT